MIRTQLPIPRAFLALQDIASSRAADGWATAAFALTWIAAARMVQSGNVTGVDKVEELVGEPAWSQVERAGLAIDALDRVLGTRAELGKERNGFVRACDIVKELAYDMGGQPWDVLPTLATFLKDKRSAEGMVSSEVAELMLDMLGKPNGSLWIPFDAWGVLTIRALRRGWSVNSAQLLPHYDSSLSRLLAIEFGKVNISEVSSEIERDREGRPLTRADFVLALPVFGMQVRDSKLAQWDSSEDKALERYYRSETWAIQELTNRTGQKAVFLVPPSVLFSRGQEERLREHLLERNEGGNELQSIVALPGGVYPSSNIGAAVVSVTPGRDNSEVLMVDLGLAKRSSTNVDELVREFKDVALGLKDDPERACRVTPDAIRATDMSFTPSRYLQKRVDVGPNAVALENICEVLKAPVLSKDDDAVERVEVGIADTSTWRPVAEGPTKVARIKHRRDLPTLEQGDLVVSIKGTIGKVALMGAISLDAMVVSQTCLGLRIKQGRRDTVSPEFLLMYLRSPSGQTQLQGLQAGSAIQHISPQTLMNSFLVPVPDVHERDAVEQDYRRLCELEAEKASLEQQMSDLCDTRWPA